MFSNPQAGKGADDFSFDYLLLFFSVRGLDLALRPLSESLKLLFPISKQFSKEFLFLAYPLLKTLINSFGKF